MFKISATALALLLCQSVHGTTLGCGQSADCQFKQMLEGDNSLWVSLDDEHDNEWWWSTDFEELYKDEDEEKLWAEGNVQPVGQQGLTGGFDEDGDDHIVFFNNQDADNGEELEWWEDPSQFM